ncbi:MAG: acetolactate decarboxylase [Lentisphaerota bacterium]
MKKIILFSAFILFLSSGIFAGQLYQLGTINSMMKGYYEGVMEINEVKSFANMGLGTTTKLGEVVGIDSKFYLADPNGNAKQMNGKTQVPYLTAVSFSPDNSFKVDYVKNSKDFYALLEKKLKGDNIFYAIRVDGSFQSVEARSEDFLGDEPVPLGEWIKNHQKSFTFKNISGTLVIFKCPECISGIGVGGYHAHFLSNDKKVGGHVFDFTIIKGKVSVETIYEMNLILPETEKFQKADLSGANDKSADMIKAIETKE